MRLACAVMSFCRPAYLGSVLDSLDKSLRLSNQQADIFLFQDGYLNKFSGVARASSLEIETCIDLFRSTFPSGQILASDVNIGVCNNFDRAEKYLFLSQSYDAVIFLEDDLLIDKRYISVLLSMLITFGGDGRICAMACYGSHHTVSHQIQLAQKDVLGILEHNWAFALTREGYLRRQPHVQAYVDLLRDIDYMNKGERADLVHKLQRNLGFQPHVISQDMFKTMAAHALGMININTNIVLGSYIGEVGIHSDASHYAAMRYNETILYPPDYSPPSFENLSELDYQRLLEMQASYIRQSSPHIGD